MRVAEPWERRCRMCEGSGQVMSLAWASWHEHYARLERIPDLPSRLHALAEHVRRAPSEVEVLACPECIGEGVAVTELGEALLDFLERRAEHWQRPAEPTGSPGSALPPAWEPSLAETAVREDAAVDPFFGRTPPRPSYPPPFPLQPDDEPVPAARPAWQSTDPNGYRGGRA